MFNLDEIASTNLAQIHCSNLALSRVIPGFVKPALIFFFLIQGVITWLALSTVMMIQFF